MRDLGYISEAEYQKEVNAPIQTRLTRVAEQVGTPTRMNESLHAEYVAELVRTLMFDIFQQETYTRGLNVYTTINSEDQGYAYKALRSHPAVLRPQPRLSRSRGKSRYQRSQDTRIKTFPTRFRKL